jgi:integrase
MFTQEFVDQIGSIVEAAVEKAVTPRIAPRWLDYELAGQYTSKTAEAIRAYVSDGYFPVVVKDGKRWIDREDIEPLHEEPQGIPLTRTGLISYIHLNMAKRKRVGRRPKGEGSLFRRGNIWWFKLVQDGAVLFNGPTGKSDVEEARSERDKILRKLGDAASPTSAQAAVTVGELLDDYIAYLHENRKKSAEIIEQVLDANIRPVFGKRAATSVTSDELRAHRVTRAAEDEVSEATLNNELSYMRSAYIHGKKRQTPAKVTAIPYFPIVRVDNARAGFVEFTDYRKILAELPSSLKPLFVVGYHSGCRKGELTGLQWPRVDFQQGVIELEPARTKNGHGRYLPFYGDLRGTLERQKAIRDAQFPDCPWVFFWHAECAQDGVRVAPGDQIRKFGGSWKSAVKRAGHEGLLFHDLRRSAVRNMVQKAKISEARALKISGHKTFDMLRRYNIVALADVMATGAEMDAWMKQQAAQPREDQPRQGRKRSKV